MDNLRLATAVVRSVLIGISMGGNLLGGWEDQYHWRTGGRIARAAAEQCQVPQCYLAQIEALGASKEKHLSEPEYEGEVWQGAYINAIARVIASALDDNGTFESILAKETETESLFAGVTRGNDK